MARTVKQAHGGALRIPEKGDKFNEAGRPPKLLSTIVSELKAKGYERATANNVVEAFETLLNVPEDVLSEMVKDKSQPMSLRIVGKAMLTAKGFDVLQAMMDRAHGKAKQSVEHQGDAVSSHIHITREVIHGATKEGRKGGEAAEG